MYDIGGPGGMFPKNIGCMKPCVYFYRDLGKNLSEVHLKIFVEIILLKMRVLLELAMEKEVQVKPLSNPYLKD